MHVNNCFLVLAFISATSIFLNKFAPVFLKIQGLYQQYLRGDLLLSSLQCLLAFLCSRNNYIKLFFFTQQDNDDDEDIKNIKEKEKEKNEEEEPEAEEDGKS